MRNLDFNKCPSSVLHMDINSCFATIEQQANPLLRGRPVIVAAYDSPSGCVLASSVEAKRFGVKTGMRVKEAKLILPDISVLPPDPAKYRFVHLAIRNLVSKYTYDFFPKSIDEFVLRFDNSMTSGLVKVAKQIKKDIKKEVGDWLTVSIGIAPSYFWAKTASNLIKPDGLVEINYRNVERVFSFLTLTDLHGINTRNAMRLNLSGIFNSLDFLRSDYLTLRSAFRSISSFYWYARLRGWDVDKAEFKRKTYGNSFALPYSHGSLEELLPVLQKLVEKTSARLRRDGFVSRGVYLSFVFKDGSFWHKGQTLEQDLFDSRDIYKKMVLLLHKCPKIKPVSIMAESCFNLRGSKEMQLNLFDDMEKKKKLVEAIDNINTKWGEFSVTPSAMKFSKYDIVDRISFGGVKEIF